MPLLAKFRSFLENVFLGRRVEAELDQEVRSHLEMLVEEHQRAGMSGSEARRAAQLEIGGMEQVKEQVREERIGNWLRSVSSDCRYGVRRLCQHPMFTLVAALTLGLGIGANTAIFSVIYGVLIRPLAVPEANQVVQVVLKEKNAVTNDAFTYKEFRYLQQNSSWPSAMAAFTHVGFNLATAGAADRVSALDVSADYFRVTGAAPILGREFSREEDHDPGARVAILSYGLWKRRFAASPAVLGTLIHLNGTPYEVIGVMPQASSEIELDWVPPAFGDLKHADLWTTLAPVADSVGSGENLSVVARLEPHVTFHQAESQLEALSLPFRLAYLEGEGQRQSLGVTSVQEVMSSQVGTYLWILFAAVALVLLIACANVANLLLAEGSVRSREVAIRRAAGASRQRLVRQFLVESLILSGLGCALGLLIAQLAVAGLLRSAPIQLPRVGEIRVDGRAFLFALAAALLACAFCAVLPAWRTARAGLNVALNESSTRSSGDRRGGFFRGALVVAEIALSIMLLIGASLLGQTFLNLLRVDPGFEPAGVLSAEIWLTGSRYRGTPEISAFFESLVGRLEQLPGVDQAAVVSLGQPLERGGNDGAIVNGVSVGAMNFRVVTPGYFRTLRAAIERGRDFLPLDAENAEPVAIVNEAFVREVLHGADPFAATVETENKERPRRVVGVARDVRSHMEAAEEPTVFLPAAQAPAGLILGFDVWFPTHVLVRTSGDPRQFANQVRAAIGEQDPTIPVGRVMTLDQVEARSLAMERFMMTVVGVFAAAALLLAAIGIYGVISFAVAQKTQEYGIRLALGAGPGRILGLVLRQVAVLAIFGTAAGILGAVVLYHTMASVLFGVEPADPRILTLCAACLLAVVIAAGCVPARRATRVDPAVALRYE
jgi:putative ABC transport system permease protein